MHDEMCATTNSNFCPFFEALASYQLARQRSNEATKLIQKGEVILAKMKCWSEHSSWNWENKSFLLEAEKMHTLGNFDKAGPLYISAIRSAYQHKFVHEEAIASELAGLFYCERGLHDKSKALLIHCVRCYQKWGALAIAKRVEAFVASKYGPGLMQMSPNNDALGTMFVLSGGASKKRQEREQT